jgi:hypothetical protein
MRRFYLVSLGIVITAVSVGTILTISSVLVGKPAIVDGPFLIFCGWSWFKIMHYRVRLDYQEEIRLKEGGSNVSSSGTTEPEVPPL